MRGRPLEPTAVAAKSSLELGPTVDSGSSIPAATVSLAEDGTAAQRSPPRAAILPRRRDSATALRRFSDVDDQEHLADVMRLRMVMNGALLLWLATALLDWSVVRFVQPGPLAPFLLLRGLAWLVMAALVLRLYRQPAPSPRAFLAIELGIFFSATLTASLLCLRYRGISSPYAHAMSCILVVRGVALPSHYRRGIPAVLFLAMVFPLTMLGAARFQADIAQQLHDAAQLAIFLQNGTLVVVTGIVTVLGGHTIWALRRQVFVARNIGRYRLQQRIGEGGMGEVWQAYHPALKRAVAIKLLRAQQTSSQALARFEREVRATSELTHPNTIRVLDFGVTEDGLWYYAMELLDGENVGQLVERDGPLPVERALRLLRQACRAIAEAHSHGIVHRDIKPDNLFVTNLGGERDFIKVLDFGIAKVLDEEDLVAPTKTGEGTLLGTPAFMPPEQFEGREIDARADVFSLGAVLYFMLTGRAPYNGPTLSDIRSAHFHPVRRPSELTAEPLPSDLEAIIVRCLDREPGHRFLDASALDAALSVLPPAAPATPTGASQASLR